MANALVWSRQEIKYMRYEDHIWGPVQSTSLLVNITDILTPCQQAWGPSDAPRPSSSDNFAKSTCSIPDFKKILINVTILIGKHESLSDRDSDDSTWTVVCQSPALA